MRKFLKEHRCQILLASLAVLLMTGRPARAGLIRFLVGEYGETVHGDSFVITIDEAEPLKLAHARSLIDWVETGAEPENSPGDTIIVAPIMAGADGINRDHLAVGEPVWNWHVSGPAEFAFNTIEILDGWPTFVEQDIPGWIANTNGMIGFWNYTIVRELGPVEDIPEPSTLLLFACGGAGLVWMVRRRADRQWRKCRRPVKIIAKP
jgi:hypothetical protein